MIFVGIDDRQVRGHVEIGAARDRVAELHFRSDDRLRHGGIIKGRVAVTREDRTDHVGVPLAPRARAQGVDPLSSAFDLGGAVSLVSKGAKRQPVDRLRLRLRIGSRADSARRCTVKMRLLPAGFLHHDRHCGLEIVHAAGDVGTIAG